MNMLMTILSLALSAGSLVPVFVKKAKRKRTATILVAIVGVSLGITVILHWFRDWDQRQMVENEVSILLANHVNQTMTFEEIRIKLDRYDYKTLSEAVDACRNKNWIWDQVIEVTSSDGVKHTVRVYGKY